jgi:hypothetical protein
MSDSIREIVPEVAKVSKELSASSVLTGRRRVRLIAQNGQSFTSAATGGAQTINFLIQDGGAFLDPTSCVLSFDLTAWDASTSPATNANKVHKHTLEHRPSTIIYNGRYRTSIQKVHLVHSTQRKDTCIAYI